MRARAQTVLAARWRVLRNEGNENNEVGLPLTLLRLGPEHEALWGLDLTRLYFH